VAVSIYVKPADHKKSDYIIEKNDNGIWIKKEFFPIHNFLTNDVYVFNIEKNTWEKKSKKSQTINTILRIKKDGTKDISYDLGLKWFKITETEDNNNEEIIAYYNQNEETINYQLNTKDYPNIKEIALFDISGKELIRTNELQIEGKIKVKNINSNVIFIRFEFINSCITKKVIIH
jgi:hypothetical protein